MEGFGTETELTSAEDEPADPQLWQDVDLDTNLTALAVAVAVQVLGRYEPLKHGNRAGCQNYFH